ncbi:MAG: hypothetical protein QXD77_00105 [Candidatus Aenigmatarchaeota archaeon]
MKIEILRLKGAGFAWLFGLMMVAVVVAVFAVGAVQHYNAQVLIVSSAAEAYDTVHVGEFTKRTLDGAAFAAGHAAVRELAAEGGGFSVWTNETPSEAQLVEMLEKKIGEKMDLVTFNGLTRREISWEKAKLSITKYDDSGFSFEGNKPFTVESRISTPQMTVDYTGAFETGVTSNYFKLIRIGKATAQCPAEPIYKTIEGVQKTITATDTDKYAVNITDISSGLELLYTLDCAGKAA